jgi:hypothetical protein
MNLILQRVRLFLMYLHENLIFTTAPYPLYRQVAYSKEFDVEYANNLSLALAILQANDQPFYRWLWAYTWTFYNQICF